MTHAGQMTKVKFPHKRVDPIWGESLGAGPRYITRRGGWIWEHINKRHVRFFDRNGRQVGVEQDDIVGAVVAASTYGWKRYRGVDDSGMCWIAYLERDLLGDLQICQRRIYASEMCEDCGDTHSILECKDASESSINGSCEMGVPVTAAREPAPSPHLAPPLLKTSRGEPMTRINANKTTGPTRSVIENYDAVNRGADE